MSLKPIVRSDGLPVMTWGAVNALLMCSLDANEAWEPNLSHIENGRSSIWQPSKTGDGVPRNSPSAETPPIVGVSGATTRGAVAQRRAADRSGSHRNQSTGLHAPIKTERPAPLRP